MKKLLGIVVLGFLFSLNVFADLNYEPIRKTYVIEDHILNAKQQEILDVMFIIQGKHQSFKNLLNSLKLY